MSLREEAIRSPGLFLMALECRVIPEFTAGVFYSLSPHHQRRGDGHPVVVLPGFLAGDLSTVLLRLTLNRCGFAASGWGMGINFGVNKRVLEGIVSRIQRIADQSGQSVSLVGWSLGGVIAREIARRHPHKIRQIITLGSPIRFTPKANNLFSLSEILTGRRMTEEELASFLRRQQPPPVPVTALFSRTDGIAAWQTCQEMGGPTTRNREVVSSHLGFVSNPFVIREIIKILTQRGSQSS